ncbi:MAG: isopentenyl-diphosphate Delta-isomerase [Polyangiales bacterium]
MQDRVLLVDELDRALGVMDKLEAHEKGVLHRAFSAFVFREVDGQTQTLLQKRARAKYHFGGLWTNTCCGHPLEGETPAQAGMRRLPEEMNFTCSLRPTDSFIYRAQSENKLFEHELDHVLVGRFEAEAPPPNPDEADDARWISFDQLDHELATAPHEFTPWFPLAYAIARKYPR